MLQYEQEIVERFPFVQAGVARVCGVDNTSVSDGLVDDYQAQQQEALDRLNDTPIAEIESVAAWRRVFSNVGVKPTRHRVAVEALLRRLQKAGDIPSISPLVDIGNLVSIRHAIPVAVFDVARFEAPITVRFASGAEHFADLRSDHGTSPEAGEVIFVDADGSVCARRWCWRQSSTSATSGETTGALFVIEAHHSSAQDDVADAIRDVEAPLARHQPQADISAVSFLPGDEATSHEPPEAP